MYDNPSFSPDDLPTTPGPIDVRPEIRTFARAMREMFAGLQQEGFSEAQAMHIIGVSLAASLGGGR